MRLFGKSKKKIYNEINLLTKYTKSVLWRVVERLSYILDAWCLKVKIATSNKLCCVSTHLKASPYCNKAVSKGSDEPYVDFMGNERHGYVVLSCSVVHFWFPRFRLVRQVICVCSLGGGFLLRVFTVSGK